MQLNNKDVLNKIINSFYIIVFDFTEIDLSSLKRG